MIGIDAGRLGGLVDLERPRRLPWSVIARAFMPSSTVRPTSLLDRARAVEQAVVAVAVEMARNRGVLIRGLRRRTR